MKLQCAVNSCQSAAPPVKPGGFIISLRFCCGFGKGELPIAGSGGALHSAAASWGGALQPPAQGRGGVLRLGCGGALQPPEAS